MRILYIGDLSNGGTCLERKKSLERLGCEIISFNIQRWISDSPRIFKSLAYHFRLGPDIWKLNSELVRFCRNIKSMHIDLIWVDKGTWVYYSTLEAIKNRCNAKLIHYTPDPQLVFHKSRYFEEAIPFYDLMVTTKPFEIDLYKAKGVRNLFFAIQGYDERFIEYKLNADERSKWLSDVCFVGHSEKHYFNYIKYIHKNVNNLKVWGPGWDRSFFFNPWVKSVVKGNGVWGDDYLKVLGHTKIGLGFLSKYIPETTTTRSFEIPASGTFLLAERTDDHIALFKEGKEADFFSSKDELKDKITFYLKNSALRKRIALAGRKRCLYSDYSSQNQLRKILNAIKF